MNHPNNRGITWIELLVFAGVFTLILLILFSLYSPYTVKVRQSEARIALGAVHTVVTATIAEWGYASPCLKKIGFLPSGQRGYAVGFSRTPEHQYPYGKKQEYACEEADIAVGAVISTTGKPPGAEELREATVRGNVFLAKAIARATRKPEKCRAESSPPTDLDTWSINEKKELKNIFPCN